MVGWNTKSCFLPVIQQEKFFLIEVMYFNDLVKRILDFTLT